MSSDLAKLYSGKLLKLAADIPHLGTLEDPQARVKERAPLCGSTVSVDVSLTDGRIKEFAQDVKACALGQASASVLGSVVMGASLDELKMAKEQFVAFLKEDGPIPEVPFDGFEALLPAREYKNRHASILLALSATISAVEQALSSSETA